MGNVYLVWEVDLWEREVYHLILVTLDEEQAKEISGMDNPIGEWEEADKWYEVRKLGKLGD